MSIYNASDDLKQFIQSIEYKSYNSDYVFVILGRTGPTGKTYLTNKIISNGYRAIDMSEKLLSYHILLNADEENHYDVDEKNKIITVVLNKELEKLNDDMTLYDLLLNHTKLDDFVWIDNEGVCVGCVLIDDNQIFLSGLNPDLLDKKIKSYQYENKDWSIHPILVVNV